MAKYEITYSCGCSGEVTLFGPMTERNRKIEWYEKQALCPDCREESLQKEREAATAEAASFTHQHGLPELTGSKKQVAWAEVIRQKSIEDLVPDVVGPEGNIGDMFQKLQNALTDDNKGGAEFLLGLIREPSAKWWIDHRGQSLSFITRSHFSKKD